MVGRSGVRRRLKILFPVLLILCSANFILFHRSTGYLDSIGKILHLQVLGNSYVLSP